MKKFYSLLLVVLVAMNASAQIPSVSIDLTDRLLVNPDFEFKDIVDENSGDVVRTPFDISIKDTFRGLPTGWNVVEGSYSGDSWGLSNDAVGFHGNAKLWVSFTKFNDDFKLYQTIPSDKLEPGIYKVSCLMYVEKDYYGAACLFANNNVEYWGSEDQYVNNQTSTDENITYANYAGGSTKAGSNWFLPMAVYVQVKAGEDLQLGIRSSSRMGGDGKAKTNAGKFQVDNFRIEKVLSTQAGPNELVKELITNYDFENKSETEVFTGKPDLKEYVPEPYGWTTEASGEFPNMMGYTESYIKNFHGKSGFSVSDSIYEIVDFKMYQEIPSEKITPGLYRVYCRLWQYKEGSLNLYGTGRFYGQSGDNIYSMFYGKNEDYGDNLMEINENYTFGNYVSKHTSTVYDHPLYNLFVDVPVLEGNGLTLGIKTSSLDYYGGYDSYGSKVWQISRNNLWYNCYAGWFMTDCFGIFRESGNPVSLSENPENNENTIKISNYNKVTLNKEFVNNQWNSVCLPFSLNAADIATIFGQGTQVAQFASANGDEIQFCLTENIEAGKAYIIKPTDVLPSPIILDDVSLTADQPAAGEGEVSFKGVFAPTSLGATDKMVNAEGKTESASQANSFSAYLTGVNTENVSIKFVTTGIDNIVADKQADDVEYNLAGQKVGKNYKGIRIVNNKKVVR